MNRFQLVFRKYRSMGYDEFSARYMTYKELYGSKK